MLTAVFPNDVRQTMEQFRRSVDRMFDNAYGAGQAAEGSSERGWVFTPVIESGWDENALHLRAILPGVSDKDLQVSVQNNQLILEGERKAPEGFDKKAFTQLAYGRFYAAITLPTGLNVEQVACHLNHGVLDIAVPIQEASKPKTVAIQTGDKPATKTIAA